MKLKSTGYNILFDKNGYSELNKLIKKYYKIVLIVDENTKKYCFDYFLNKINFDNFLIIETKSGEENKNLNSLENIINILIENNIDKKSVIINLGGGLLSDLGGFVASIYKRGIDFINIPTTLLSMVDASIGIKTGINFNGIKNILGSFFTPKMVLIDIYFLETLNKKEILSGYSEMIKHRFIKGECEQSFVRKIQINKEEIIKSISIKNEIVMKDLNEKKERKILNFGHTIGHGIESFFLLKKQKITHGEAIAIGMICEFFLASKKNIVKKEFLECFKEDIILNFEKYYIGEEDFDNIISLMKNDKKNEEGKILFSLVNEKGKFFLDEEFLEKDIKESLTFYKN